MSIELTLTGRARDLGGGFTVQRVLPERHRRNVGPFVFLDHMGPVALAPGEGMDVRPHPHVGLSTVTYLFEGEIVHRDSLGSVQTITPGAINLMRAGRGIVHSERSPAAARAAGARVHGAQLWLALPEAAEDAEPAFAHHPADTLPAWRDGGIGYRLLIGELGAYRSPVTDPSQPIFVDLMMDAGATFEVPDAIADAAVYVIDGALDGVAARQLAVRAPGTPLSLTATAPTRALLVGGPALDHPRFMDWNFVATSKERIAAAVAGWKAQTFPRIPDDDHDFVPYPS
jgi:redox-sensitive bicupin YhaK (pirin superfamily)